MTLADYNAAVDLHADGIYRFALKHLRDADVAKDVVQESFARLFLPQGLSTRIYGLGQK